MSSQPVQVIVADNYHYQDRDYHSKPRAFADMDSAIAACKKIVDDWLEGAYQPGMTADALYASYTSFGDDPFIVAPDIDGTPFSAWAYAREQAKRVVERRRSA